MKISNCSRRPILSPCSLKDLDYQVDPYVGCKHYCYYCYALDQVETDWEKEILIHKNIESQLSEELEKIPPQKIYMGYKTDPYQPCEVDSHQTRKALDLFLKKGFSASILTKSDLVTRDVDVLQAMDGATVSVSVAFNDNGTRRKFEANTMDTEARIEALRELKEAGIKTDALLCPIIPYITDATALIDMLAPHADVIWIYGLSMNKRSDQNWQNVQGILDTHFPSLKKQIETVVFSKEHTYWAELRKDLVRLQNDRGLNLNIHI